MGSVTRISIEWDTYRPAPAMAAAVDALNQLSFDELLATFPEPGFYEGAQLTFGYRVFSEYPFDEIEHVYVLVSGFGERADTLDAGVKGLLTDLLVKQIDDRKYAVLVIGGLFSFPVRERDRLLKQGSGAVRVVADAVAGLLPQWFPALQTVTVSGYSLGGVMAPLIARSVMQQAVARVEQVCCGEPAYAEHSTNGLQLLKRVARASAYRNEQIEATAITAYIAIKQTPRSGLGKASYRARLYRPLLRRSLSMRLVARDLALQARHYPAVSDDIQLHTALRYLAQAGVNLQLLHAEHSVLCQGESFYDLLDDLGRTTGARLQLTLICGSRADHGIEEQRSLSTPFLVMPDLYRTDSAKQVRPPRAVLSR